MPESSNRQPDKLSPDSSSGSAHAKNTDFGGPAEKKRPSLFLLLGGAWVLSSFAAFFLAALVWWLCSHSLPWMNVAGLYNTLNYVEPFEIYTHASMGKKIQSELVEGQRTVELTPGPADKWEQWTLHEYLAQTAREDPYLVFPFAASEENLAKRRAAFDEYDKVMEDERDSIEPVVNRKIFFFDLSLYLVVFSLATTLLVLLFRRCHKI